MLVSKNIPNLLNGVSQQPDAIRSDTQCEDQINAYPSIVEGLTKRMPTEHQDKIDVSGFSSPFTPGSKIFTHFIDRDSTERYIFFLDQNAKPWIYDIENGVERPVTTTNADSSYITSTEPASNFKAVTIADVTFLVNTSKTVERDNSSLRANPPNGNLDADQAIIFVKQGKFGAKYEVNFHDGTSNTAFVYETPDGLVSSAPAEADTGSDGDFDGGDFGTTESESAATNYIAKELAERLDADGDLTAVQIGSSVYVKYTGSASFTITVNDSNGGRDMLLIKDEVQSFSELPVEARHGYTVLVKGNPEEALDDYYVEFKASNSGDGNGVWIERDKPGNKYKWNEATMPHVLIRTWSGSTPVFELRKASDSSSEFYWRYREVGDDTTNPFPTFVDQKITDIFLFKNRLGILAGESIVFSRAGAFFNFFRSTVLDILDSQPIDVQAAHNKVALMHSAVPFVDRLILFSDHSQFSLIGDPILTTKTVSITPTTDYSNLSTVTPIPVARSIYYAYKRGSYSGVQEYFPSGDGETFASQDITASVPQYISGNITKLATASQEKVMVALASGKTDSIYVYNYHSQDAQRLQNSWHRFEFGTSSTIMAAEFIQSTLFLVIKRGSDYFIEKLNFEPGAVDTGSDYYTRLDRRVSYAADGGRGTTFTLPYVPVSGRSIEIITTTGERITATTNGTTTVTAAKSLANLAFFAGEAYTMTYEFSDVTLKEATRAGGSAIAPKGRLQVRYGTIVFADSGGFSVTITNDQRDANTHTFTGRILGSAINLLGNVPFESGEFRFPVFSKADKTSIVVTNDSPLPCKLMAAEFELSYNPRTRRMRA